MAAGDALIETAKDAPHLLAAMRKVLEVADEFDTEDAHVPAQPGQAAISRGDRARHAILTGLFTGSPACQDGPGPRPAGPHEHPVGRTTTARTPSTQITGTATPSPCPEPAARRRNHHPADWRTPA